MNKKYLIKIYVSLMREMIQLRHCVRLLISVRA